MPTTDPAVDAYIAKAQAFAKPILARLRTVIHLACPECVEVIKWGMPAFDYKGPLCSIASFKAHCVMTFWKAALLNDPQGVLQLADRKAMGHLGRIAGIEDLPGDKVLAALIRQAMRLNDEGVRVKRPVKKKTPLRVPAAALAAIRAERRALATWTGFPPSHRREYVEWITEAKTEATRERRIRQMIALLIEGKHRHWKYAK